MLFGASLVEDPVKQNQNRSHLHARRQAMDITGVNRQRWRLSQKFQKVAMNTIPLSSELSLSRYLQSPQASSGLDLPMQLNSLAAHA